MASYMVQVIPNDRDPDNQAMIHLNTCPDYKKLGPIVGRADLVGQWFGTYGSYQEAKQFAGTNKRTGGSKTCTGLPHLQPATAVTIVALMQYR